MSHASIAWLAWAALVLSSAPAAAERIELDLRGAVERARRAAPEAIAALRRIREAEARLVGASVLFDTNPALEGGAGPRLTSGRPIDADVRLEQELEPGRRGARRGAARAEIAHARAEADVSLRELDLG